VNGPLAKLHKSRRRSCRFASQRLAKRRFQLSRTGRKLFWRCTYWDTL